MTYDSSTHSVILFGGSNHTSDYGNDTWSFQGGAWTQLHPSPLPPGRDGQEMVYDDADQEVVMFGGTGTVVPLNDTWTYSSVGLWAPIPPGNHPGARVGAGMAYAIPEGKVVLYGGSPAPDDYYATWLFSGGSWTEYNLTTNPPNPTNPWEQMIYDPIDNYTVLYYLPDLTGTITQTWVLRFTPSSARAGDAPSGALGHAVLDHPRQQVDPHDRHIGGNRALHLLQLFHAPARVRDR